MQNFSPFQPQAEVPTTQLEFEKKALNFGTPVVVGLTLAALIGVIYAAQSLNAWAQNTEKTWSFISNLVTISGTIAGLWLIWLKFFKQRENAAKLEITPTSGKIPLPDHSGNLHWLNLKLENKGNQAIQNYQLAVQPLYHQAGTAKLATAAAVQFSIPHANKARAAVIDVGAASFEHGYLTVKLAEAEAVTFVIEVTAAQTKWYNGVTVSNAIEADQQNKKKSS